MVTNVTSLGRSGLSDFVLQRVSAVILAAYALCITGFFVVTDVDHASLVGFFSTSAMTVFTTLAVVSFAVHAWIGMWTIGTDYIQVHHVGGIATVLRIVYQFACLAIIFLFLLWTLSTVWSLS